MGVKGNVMINKEGLRVEELKELVWRMRWRGLVRRSLADDEDDCRGRFQPHTADQKPRRDIINSWIFCVFHLDCRAEMKGAC